MKTRYVLLSVVVILLCLAVGCNSEKRKAGDETLKSALSDKFLIGTAVNVNQAAGRDLQGVEIVKKHFNAIVAENCMKSENLQPGEGAFFFDDADELVAFGEANGMFITGHTLIWHSQAPAWFFTDKDGNDVSREVLLERMKSHITTVVSKYKGRVKGWDVVNEAILDDGSWRQSKFFEIIGEDYIRYAFEWAHEADPDADLYYNDYSMAHPGKREAVVRMVNALKKQGIRIDGIGMQGHLSMDFPTVDAFEKSLLAFASTGVKVMITELDLTVLPSPRKDVGADLSTSFEYKQEMNPYPNGLPAEKSKEWNNRMNDFFKLFLKHHDKISRVTLWGVADGDSWRNNWPIPGRTDYPLLFDRSHQPKPVVEFIINEAKNKDAQ